MTPTLALVAGEASGDLLAAQLLGGLRQRWPDMRTVGIGGPQMMAQGFEVWWPSEKLAVRGYAEVLRHYAEIAAIRRRLRERLLAHPPALFIGVDAPDFNLGLEQNLRQRGIKTLHFICPSIWAWRAERVKQIKASADHVLCIFPFEPPLLAQHGISATYVGHPLASVIPLEPQREAARAQLGFAASDTVLAVLPGSRASEIHYLAERFFAAARLVAQAHGQLKIVVPAAPAQLERVRLALQKTGMAEQVVLLQGQSHLALQACDLVLVASGTATLEAALFKRPMVIAYNMHPLSWWLMRRMRLQAWVGLPNILCAQSLVPELLQDQATPQALARALLDWLDAPQRITQVRQAFEQLHLELRRDTAALASDAINTLIQR